MEGDFMKLSNGTDAVAKPYQEKDAEEIVGIGSVCIVGKSVVRYLQERIYCRHLHVMIKWKYRRLQLFLEIGTGN